MPRKSNWTEKKKNVPIKIGANQNWKLFQNINLAIRYITHIKKLVQLKISPIKTARRKGTLE